jgi:hypothetical protein
MTKPLDQISLNTGSATIPARKILTVGHKKRPAPVNQGDIFNSGKIIPGNLPQDQIEVFSHE